MKTQKAIFRVEEISNGYLFTVKICGFWIRKYYVLDCIGKDDAKKLLEMITSCLPFDNEEQQKRFIERAVKCLPCEMESAHEAVYEIKKAAIGIAEALEVKLFFEE